MKNLSYWETLEECESDKKFFEQWDEENKRRKYYRVMRCYYLRKPVGRKGNYSLQVSRRLKSGVTLQKESLSTFHDQKVI